MSESLYTHSDRIRWNQKYRGRLRAEKRRGASEFLRRRESLLRSQPKGPALDIACGMGRNAIYLAQLGFEVDAVDISDVAIKSLKEQAQRLQLPIRPLWMDLQEGRLPRQDYCLIVNVNYLERKLFPAIKQALALNGLLLFETFTREEIDLLGKKINPAFTLRTGELRQTFSDLEIVYYKEEIITNGKGSGEKAVARLIARMNGD